MPNLLSQAFVEGQRSRFGTRIVRDLPNARKASKARDCDDVAVVLLDHAGQKLLHGPEVRHGVDVHRQTDLVVRLVKDSSTEPYTCIVDQDGGISMVPPDLAGRLFHGRSGRDIRPVEEDI